MKNKIDCTNLSSTEIYELVLSKKISRFPILFWEKPDSLVWAKEILIYLIENILKWNRENIIKNLSYAIFQKYKLKGMITTLFNDSPYLALNNAYPKEFKQWELWKSIQHCWNYETGKEALKWLLEEKLKWSDNEIKLYYKQDIFKKYGLFAMLRICFSSSPYKALNTIYPDKFKEWELAYTPHYFWTEEKCIEATKWLIEEKLQWSKKEIIENLKLPIFYKYRLTTAIKKYRGSPYLLMKTVYPNEIWEELQSHLKE